MLIDKTGVTSMKEAIIKVLDLLGLAWWVEVTTDSPSCTYYFGPFLKENDAIKAKGGYIEDLEQENAQGITAQIKRCKPKDLTVFDESGESLGFRIANLSGQLS